VLLHRPNDLRHLKKMSIHWNFHYNSENFVFVHASQLFSQDFFKSSRMSTLKYLRMSECLLSYRLKSGGPDLHTLSILNFIYQEDQVL